MLGFGQYFVSVCVPSGQKLYVSVTIGWRQGMPIGIG